MKKHKLFSVLLSVVLLLNVITIPQTAVALGSVSLVSWQDKIDEDVYESPIYENGKRLVYINRTNIPKDTISEHLLKNYKYDSTVYEDEARYEAEIVPAVTAKVVAELGEKEAYSIQRQLELTGEKISAVDIALSDDYNEYIMAKRMAAKDLYVESNSVFLEDNIDNEDDIIYQGQYTSSFILYATDAEIEKYAKAKDVVRIEAFYNYEVKNMAIPEEQTQIRVDSISGTKSSQFNSGNGYKGTGIKIGIIEAAYGKYDPNAPQLSTMSSEQLEWQGIVIDKDNITTSFDNVNIDEDAPYHATMVTSLIVGQPYTVNGYTYEGVVPMATAYQIGVHDAVNIAVAFSALADSGVSVINLSAGVVDNTTSYSGAFDGEFDKLIESTGVTFVVAAGNTGTNVLSPGNAYNAITVGNIVTKRYKDIFDNWVELDDEHQNNFEIRYTSSYIEDSWLANKPDVVAPGTGIEFPNTSADIVNSNGTSYSAPLVTGIVAQLHQAKNTLKSNPAATKAIIIAGASHDKVYDDSDDEPISENIYLRDKSGAGMVDAVRSMEIALANQYATFQFDIAALASSVSDIDPCCFFNVPSGKKVRLVMTYNKLHEYIVPTTGLEDNIDIAIYNNANDQLIAYSSAVYNNIEIVEFTVSQATQFYVVASLPNFEYRFRADSLSFSIACMIS